MRLYRNLQLGKLKDGTVSVSEIGWGPWQECPDGMSFSIHLGWSPPDNFAARYHPEWVKTAWKFQILNVEPTGPPSPEILPVG